MKLTIVEGETRVCSDCCEVKSIEDFALQGANGRRRKNCKVCYHAYIRSYNRENPWCVGATAKAAVRRRVASKAMMLLNHLKLQKKKGCKSCSAVVPLEQLNLVQVAALNLGQLTITTLEAVFGPKHRDRVLNECTTIECDGCLNSRGNRLGRRPVHLNVRTLEEKAVVPEWAEKKPRVAYGQRKAEAIAQGLPVSTRGKK